MKFYESLTARYTQMISKSLWSGVSNAHSFNSKNSRSTPYHFWKVCELSDNIVK